MPHNTWETDAEEAPPLVTPKRAHDIRDRVTELLYELEGIDGHGEALQDIIRTAAALSYSPEWLETIDESCSREEKQALAHRWGFLHQTGTMRRVADSWPDTPSRSTRRATNSTSWCGPYE